MLEYYNIIVVSVIIQTRASATTVDDNRARPREGIAARHAQHNTVNSVYNIFYCVCVCVYVRALALVCRYVIRVCVCVCLYGNVI